MTFVKQRRKTSYPWHITLLLGVLCGISLILFFLYQSSSILPTPVDKPLKWRDVEDALQDTDETQTLILKEISEGKLLSADWRYETFLRPLWKQAVEFYPDGPWGEMSIATSFAQMEENHINSLRSGFSNILQRMSLGDVSPIDLQDWLTEKDDPILYDQLSASEDWLIPKRQGQATNWYRIMFQNPAQDWISSQKVREILSSSLPPQGTQKIVWGPALSPEEQENTAGTLMITGMVQTAEFKAEPLDGFQTQNWKPSPLPLGVSLYPVEMSSSLTSAWTRVKPIFIWRPPPPSISRSLEPEMQAQYKAALRRDLWAALTDWKQAVSTPSTP